MWLKVLIVILFIAVLVSLSGALVFLLKDMGSKSKRTHYALGIRVSLASLLLISIFYGIYTGQLASRAPWDAGPAASAATSQEKTESQSPQLKKQGPQPKKQGPQLKI